MQVHHKLPYVDKTIRNSEQRICAIVLEYTEGLADLTLAWVHAVIDAGFTAGRV